MLDFFPCCYFLVVNDFCYGWCSVSYFAGAQARARLGSKRGPANHSAVTLCLANTLKCAVSRHVSKI